MKFLPERFLTTDDKEDESVRDPATAAFWVRICPGRFAADAQLWIPVACLFMVFDIKPGVDKDGRPVAVEAVFESRMICHPKPFSCSIKPHSEAAKAIIKQTVDLTG
ncbi:hypothetical protein BV22DRAFT_1200289 [Leucogyrophana mollusca]|uniref:Uncharacterized protein n=1 Tax=Leucogyrophana mollusca TaxID=85980 RepID=A0ACB8AWU8_9AGAM|nr:hypothetical protein BV22DRAFT_1200289 [Leucogyrophana mollusca]